MILFSYTCVVSILAFVVAVQADTQQVLNNNELSLSLSNEQVTQYKYETTIQSAAFENNQDNSVTTSINTEIVQTTQSSNELDLNNVGATDLISALNVDVTENLNGLDSDSNGNHLSDNSFTQSSNYYDYNIQNIADINAGTPSTPTSSPGSNGSPSNTSPNPPNSPIGDQMDDQDTNGNLLTDSSLMTNYKSYYYGYSAQNNVDQNGGIPTTTTSSPGSNGSPSSAIPTSPNGNLMSVPSAASDVNSKLSQPFMPMTYPIGIPGNINGLAPYNAQPSNTNSGNGSPSGHQNGGIPTTATSSPGSNGSPSSAIPTSPNGNLMSVPSAALDVNGIPSQPFMPLTYPIGIPRNINGLAPNNAQTSNTNSGNGSPSGHQNGGIPTTATSSPGSNGSPSSAIPTSPNGNLMSVPSAASDVNGIPSQPFMPMTYPIGIPRNINGLAPNNAQTSNTNSGNGSPTNNQNGGIPTTATSSPGSNGSPSSAIPTSPNGNLMSVPSAASDVNGIPSQPFMPMTYPIGIPSNFNGGLPNNAQTSNTNSDNGSPSGNQNGGIPTTATSSPGSNGSPSNTSPNLPNSPIGDQMDKQDTNGNLLTDSSLMTNYKSYYYGYSAQNNVDQNGGIPTTTTSSPGSNGSPSSAIPTSPNGNLMSVPSAASDVNSKLSQPFMPMTYPIGIPRNINGLAPNNAQPSSTNSGNGSPIGNQNGGIPTTATSSPGSNGSPSSAIPTSPNGNLMSVPSAASDVNGIPSQPFMPMTYPIGIPSNFNGGLPNNAQTSNTNSGNGSPTGNQNGGIPTTATSSPGSNGSPSSAIPTSPNGNLMSVPSASSDVNGIPSQPFMPMTYPIGIPGNINGLSPYNAQPSNTNSGNGSPIGNQNGGIPITATSSPGSNGSPSNTSPNPLNSPIGDQTDKQDTNGNLLTDSSLMTNYKSYYYGYSTQNDVDQNGEIPTTTTSSPGSNGSPSSAIPTSPNGNLMSVPSAASDFNGIPSQPFMPMTYPIGIPSNFNGGLPNNAQTSNTNSDNGSPSGNQNGGIPTTATSSPGSNGSPSNTSPNPPNSPIGDQTDKQDTNGNLLTDSSLMTNYKSYYYGYSTQNDVDQNEEIPTTATSSPGSNGSPSNIFPNYPNGDLMDEPMGQVVDSNGNKLSDNIYQTPDYNGFIQNIADQESSYSYPPEMNEDLNNQIIQESLSALYLQNTAIPDQFSFYPGIPSTMRNGNSNDALSGGGVGWNSPIDMNGSPQTLDQIPTEIEYSNMDSEAYRYLKYDNMGYELQNTNGGDVLNDGQVNIDDRYMSDNFNDINNDRGNFPLLNENGDVYNNFFYEKSPVNTARSSDTDYNTQNDVNNVDDYFENFAYDDGNLEEPSYDSYTPNLNAGYENSEPFRGSALQGNVLYDNNIYPGNILYNYNNIDDIENDQTKIGIDELIPENNQLSRTDFNTFSNSQISPTTDSYLDTDLSSDRMMYDFVDGDNIGTETIDSNYIGQANVNNVYDIQGFNEYNMIPTNVPEYNQLNKLNDDYTTTYMSNSRTFEASSSNIGTNADIDNFDGPQLLNSEYNLLTGSDFNKKSSDLNKQNSDLNNLVIDNVQLEEYLYRTTDSSNVNNLVEGTTEDNSNDIPTKTEDNRLKSIQTAVLSKNNALDVGQNVYGANGQVIGKIYKPSNNIAKTNNRHKYSGSSSYSSPSDSEMSDDLHAIEHDIKRAARDAISNVHDHIKDAYDTTKAVGIAVGSIVGNAVNDAVDDVQETAKNAYQGSKDVVKDVGNAVSDAVSDAVDDVQETAKNAYQGSKDVVKDVGNAVSDAVDDVQETAKNVYQGSKDAVKYVGNTVSGAVDDVQETAKNAYQGSKDAVKDVGNTVSGAVDDVQETAKTAYQGLKDDVNAIENAVSDATDSVEKTADNLY